MSRPATSYGRHQVAEPLSALATLHRHDGTTPLRTVDHEPKVGVLDQEDLLAQGIHTSQLVPGASDVDALGSCTAQATTAALSNVLDERTFLRVTGATGYSDVVGAEEWAIRFYHACTDQTGDPGREWPPTDCGSSGPYIASELAAMRLAGARVVGHRPEDLLSAMQAGGLLIGSPWLNAWEEPDPYGFVDGDGSLSTLEEQIAHGIAGGHETFWSAVEDLVFDPTGRVDPSRTVIRGRNSWSLSWGDHGSYRAHLSTFLAISSHCDWRQLTPYSTGTGL